MKKPFVIIGAIVLAIVIAGGSFYGGMAYQRSQNQARFFGSRGTGGANRGFGGGITGQVASINGNTMTLNTGQNSITVGLSGSTTVLKTSSDTPTDLSTGEQVLVTGQRDSSGNFTASRVIIIQSPTALSQP